jgi:hypothetical protein
LKVFGHGDESTADEPPVFQEKPSLEELQAHLTRARARLASFGNEDILSKEARKYLTEHVTTLRGMIHEAQTEEDERLRQEQVARENREFLAGEEAVRPLRDNFDARLAKGFLPLKIREQTRLRFVELAADARHQWRTAIGVESQTPVPLDEIRPSAIFKAKTSFLEEAARRLETFQWDLNSEPPLSTLDPYYFETGLILSAPYFAFRSLSEKALVAYVARKYYVSKGDISNLGRIPDLPNPIVVPNKPMTPLEVIQEFEMKRCLEALAAC